MKRLVRSKTDRKLSGLCAGVANYFQVDPTLVRLIVLLAVVLSGVVPGLLFYIIAAIITPEEDTNA